MSKFKEKINDMNWRQKFEWRQGLFREPDSTLDNQGHFLHDSSCVSVDSINQIVLSFFFFSTSTCFS